MPSTSAIKDLAGRSDENLFPLVSEGVGHLVTNFTRLHEAASNLADAGDHTSATVLGAIASEEAAKVLILLDVVRCPPSRAEERQRTLDCWNSHLWKGLYSEMCDEGLAHSHFRDVEGFVERESAFFYLDGPIGVDWIFPNEILNQRESSMYVDYVRDIAQSKGESASWFTPTTYERDNSPSPCLFLVDALVQLGVTTVQGLEVVADVWRAFEPESLTSTEELHTLIGKTLQEMEKKGVFEGRAADSSLVECLFKWPFPLWPIAKPHLDARQRKRQLSDIRQEREDRIKRIRDIERVREPRLMISEVKVKELHRAYVAYDNDRRKHEDKFAVQTPRGLKFITTGKIAAYDERSGVYRVLKRLWLALSEEERVGLAALAIFTRGQVADWAASYEQAKWVVANNDERYQMHLGSASLKGLYRYQADPPRRA